MTTPHSTASSSPAQAANLQQALLAQLYAGPSFREVAAVLLRQRLQEQHPTLDLDPDTTLLGTPTWEIVDEQIVRGPTTYQPLSDILAEQAVLARPTECIEGEHFLTRHPLTEPPTHLPVRIVDIAHTLNILAPVMLHAFQAQQVDYWNKSDGNGPHWHELSNTLRTAWNVHQVEGWSDRDCAMARLLFHAPARLGRLNDPYNIRACLIDIDQIDGTQMTHLNEFSMAVLIGQQAGQDVILTHSLLKGYEKFASLAQLGQTLPERLTPSATRQQLQWRLFEPDGNFFDHQAINLIALQVAVIGALDFSDLQSPDAPPAPILSELSGNHEMDRAWYQRSLPDWLREASTSDLNFYARHLKDLAVQQSLNGAACYQDDIPSIEPYALSVLKAEMLKQHPEAAHLPLEQLTLRVQSPVVWGAFIVPGRTDTLFLSLSELALQNLIAVPIGNKTLQWKSVQPLPAWLTVDYLEGLITQANIGQAYPALIKSKLLENPSEASRRKTLYEQQMRTQLPLLALQNKIRQEHGLDEQGYRYVSALMQAQATDRRVDGQPIVIRPLAFIPERRAPSTPDTVANMYVIGPRDPSAGPCLLYRPLFTPTLAQYPSPTNLLYAIAQSPSLRSSVLAWLPDPVRNEYANYVFPGDLPSPWAVADFLVDTSTLWTMSGPMRLDDRALDGEWFSTLYEANARALTTLADRQSVSNAENRWATFKQAGWLILNTLLPFTSPAVATGTWIWQVVEQLQQFVDAREQGDKPAQWAAFTDALLNLAMAITLHISTRLHPGAHKTEPEPGTPAVEHQVKVKQLDTLATHELPPNHAQLLHTSGAVNRAPATLGKVLDSFKVNQPQGLGTPQTQAGPYQYLSRLGEKHYAQVGERWFEVTTDEDDTVLIIDPRQPARTGPPLLHNAAGQWFVDTRLRLRGGGPKRMINKAEADATLKATEVRRKLTAFENAKKTAQHELQQTRLAMSDVVGTSAGATRRQAYLDKLDSQSADYEAALQQLKSLNVFTPLPDYPQRALSYVKAQLDLTDAGIREAQTTFTPKLRTVLDHIELQAHTPQSRQIEDARQMTQMSEDMIERLEYTQTRFSQLQTLAQDGLRLIQDAKKKLPSYTSTDLKSLQVTLARNLCLKEDTTEPTAWAALDDIVDSADLSVQALRDTVQERSESRLDERIDSLGSLIEQFKVIDERLEDFPQEFSRQALPGPVERLRERLRGFARDALSHLAILHAERDMLRNRPTPPATPPKPRKRFIHTRYNGVIIGETRLTALGLETDLVDVKSPLTQQIIATFHEKSPNVWVQRVTSTPSEVAVPDLSTSLAQGRALLDGLGAFKHRASEQASKPDRTAVGIEYLYHRHALLLEETNQHIEEALTRSNVTDSQAHPATVLGKQLEKAASDLYDQASGYMTRMIKQHPPTTAGVEWLKDRNLIAIKQSIKRRRLKSREPDYLDEYIITERSTHEVLWYAHFHYSANWTPAKSFLSARLKTTHEYRQGPAADSIKGLDEQQQIAYYRSEINLETAKRLFFDHK
ncbi:hypothetical protein [Pseudomonas gessardii]|uniref:hypothetical protein n=1 Tax=Pseudomonas gessardii TaxID=78544 RepID=UPI0018D990D9|nr:hypothetical protein [Pseudomonas gessardii]MBH3422396.1 hypothetical protein [Pseudomonas gessardii]